jgi:hypothetical protein
MSGNGSGYSNFTPGPDNVLPNPSVKGTEASCAQFDMISRAVGGKKMRKSAKMLNGGSCSSCSGKSSDTTIQSTMMGGKKSKKSVKKSRKSIRKPMKKSRKTMKK